MTNQARAQLYKCRLMFSNTMLGNGVPLAAKQIVNAAKLPVGEELTHS